MQYMKKLLLLAAALGLCLPQAGASDLAAIKAKGTIRIATNAEFKPFTFMEGNTMKGFEYDLGNLVAKQLGVKAEWVNQPFDNLLIGLGADRYDLVISSHGITPERQKAVDFSNPHYCSGAVILAKKGGPTTAAALKGKTVSSQIGTSYVPVIEKLFGKDSVKTFPDNTKALQAMQAGRVDAMINEKFYSLAAQKANPSMFVLGDTVYQERIGMAVKKGNKTLLDAVNAGIATVQKNGEYAKLSNQWFGQDVRCK